MTFDQAMELISEAVETESPGMPVKPTSTWEDLMLDSLELVHVASVVEAAAEQEIGRPVRIQNKDLANMKTAGDLAIWLECAA